MGPKTGGVRHRSVAVGLEVVDKAFVGDDASLLESVHHLSDIDVDTATYVSDGKEGVLNNHLVWDVFEVDPHVLELGHWVVEVEVDDVCLQVGVPFLASEMKKLRYILRSRRLITGELGSPS